LHSEDVEVRVEAGQCIALLIEVAREEEVVNGMILLNVKGGFQFE
jgi:hypothetical protein